MNFSAELDYDYRNAVSDFGNSLSFYNLSNPKVETSPIAYDQPSYTSKRLSSQSIYNHGAVGPAQSPCESYNCTYTLVMPGPGYKCEVLDENSEHWGRKPDKFNLKDLAPDGDLIYISNVNQGDFKKPDVIPTDPALDPEHWIPGTFHYEPELWIGYVVNTTTPLDPISSRWGNRWTHLLRPEIFHCVHYHVIYTFQIANINGQQNVTKTEIEYLRPILNTTYGTPPDPTQFSVPGDPDYKLTVAYHALGSLMRGYLVGKITLENNRPKTIPITSAELSMTNLVDPKSSYTVTDLIEGVRKLYEDIIITLMSSGRLVISANETVPCVLRRYENRFNYYQANLWIGYSIVVAVTLACIVVGAMALRSNGIASDTLFSRILVTTRNPTLDHLSRGACLGSDPFPKELEQTKLRFGAWHEGGVHGVEGLNISGLGGTPGHCAFGTIHETTEIVKGGVYAGLDIPRDCEAQGNATGPLLGEDKDDVDVDDDEISLDTYDEATMPLLI